MIQKLIILTVALIYLLSPALALQQTSGAINLNVTPGSQTFAKYGIRNEGNETINVKLSVNGSIANYIKFPSELVLNSSEFKYVNITTNVPADYSGADRLNGTIYALKEGSKGGQVQLNIRLGKNIALNIIEAPKIEVKGINAEQTSKIDPSKLTFIGIITVIALIIAMITKKRKTINKNTGDEKIE